MIPSPLVTCSKFDSRGLVARIYVFSCEICLRQTHRLSLTTVTQYIVTFASATSIELICALIFFLSASLTREKNAVGTCLRNFSPWRAQFKAKRTGSEDTEVLICLIYSYFSVLILLLFQVLLVA